MATLVCVPGLTLISWGLNESEYDFAFGRIVTMGIGQMTVEEFTGKEKRLKKVEYRLGENVEVRHVEGLSRLKPGDDVDVGYERDGDIRVARLIIFNGSWDTFPEEMLMQEPAPGN